MWGSFNFFNISYPSLLHTFHIRKENSSVVVVSGSVESSFLTHTPEVKHTF